MNTEKTYENLADLEQFKEKFLTQIERSLREFLPNSPPKIEKEFNQAIESALFSGEKKRIGPILTLLGAELFGGKAESVLPPSIAVEFIHASSKIFNELYFSKKVSENILREKPGDSMKVLVALGLLNSSYSLIFVNHLGMPERAIQAHAEIVECVGTSGLIGRMNEEFEGNSGKSFDDSLLIRLALRVGAILSGADYLDLANLSRFAVVFSEAYQIADRMEIVEYEADTNHLNDLIGQSKRILIENFPSNEARSCLIQLTESLGREKK